MKATLATLKAIYELNQNVIVVVNKFKINNVKTKDDEKDKKYENFETLKNYLLEQLGKANCNYDNLEFVCVRDSALLEDCLFTGESVQDKVQEDGFKKHIYRNVLTDIDNLMMEVCNG